MLICQHSYFVLNEVICMQIASNKATLIQLLKDVIRCQLCLNNDNYLINKYLIGYCSLLTVVACSETSYVLKDSTSAYNILKLIIIQLVESN